MHQNKFHTETIQQLTTKYDASTKGGPQLDEEEQRLADHLKILYRFANKGIKGRGKKTEPKPSTTGSQEPKKVEQQQQQQQSVERLTDSRVFTSREQSLLPLPVSKAPSTLRGMDGPAPFLGLSHSGSSWSRGEDVFVGSQGGHGQVQSNSFLGIPGDGSSGGLGGYAFGNTG
jgi:hypothetical protein